MEQDPVSRMEDEHRPAAVAARLALPTRSFVSDWILGAIDGAVTTFAIAAGAVGASLSAGAIVVLGTANLLADGLSMAAGRYSGVRADLERRAAARRTEQRHIELVPDGEREEVRQILARKGFAADDLDRVVDVVTSDTQRWVDFMLVEELGFSPEPDRPLASSLATFAGFVACGLLPLAPFVLDEIGVAVAGPMMWSAVLTAGAFLVVGAAKAHVVGLSRLPSALGTLAIGGSAATVAYLVGFGLRGVI